MGSIEEFINLINQSIPVLQLIAVILGIIVSIITLLAFFKKPFFVKTFEQIKLRKKEISYLIGAATLFILSILLFTLFIISTFLPPSSGMLFYDAPSPYLFGGESICSVNEECYRELNENNAALILYSNPSVGYLLPKTPAKLHIFSSQKLTKENLTINFNNAGFQIETIVSNFHEKGKSGGSEFENTFSIELDEHQTLYPYFLRLNFSNFEPGLKIFQINITYEKEFNLLQVLFYITYSILAFFFAIWLLEKSKKINYFSNLITESEDNDKYWGLFLEKSKIKNLLGDLELLKKQGKISPEFEKNINRASNQRLDQIEKELSNIKLNFLSDIAKIKKTDKN